MHKPVAYTLGEVEFYRLLLEVNPSVLIPRMESELLVELALKSIPKTPVIIADLCCGSGALGLAIKKERPNASVILGDISPQCVAVARRNAVKNDLDVDVRVGDLVSVLQEKCDFVICNPPYVTDSEYERLEPSVKEYEPKLALVGGVDGLDFYRKLARTLPPCVKRGGRLFFEIGKDLGEAVIALFQTPYWKGAKVSKDYAGHDRFFTAERI